MKPGNDLCSLSDFERKKFIESILIKYPVWELIFKEINRRHELGKYSGEPQCLAIVGPTGVGKTTLINYYLKKYPADKNGPTIIRPALLATLFQPPTIKNVAQAFLDGFEDPRSTFGTVGNMTHRIQKYKEDCKTEIIFVDEIQEFFNRDKQKIMQNVSNWLKFIIKDLIRNIYIVGIGRASRADYPS